MICRASRHAHRASNFELLSKTGRYHFKVTPGVESANPERFAMTAHAFIRCLGRLAVVAATVALGLQGNTPTLAQTKTDLQLVLAVDASGSVNETRFELQKQGYVAAFRNPRVLNAIRSLSTQSIVVTMVQWTGPELQIQVVPWTLIKDQASIEAFAATIEQAPRQLFSGGTSISGAIDYAMLLMPTSPYHGIKRVIDISGDGSNNRGRDVVSARDDAVRAGVIINGLPILSLEPDLDRYYFDRVIGGPGSFVVATANYETFAEAVLRKLILEIAALPDPR
jgi:hypothetical protein